MTHISSSARCTKLHEIKKQALIESWGFASCCTHNLATRLDNNSFTDEQYKASPAKQKEELTLHTLLYLGQAAESKVPLV